MDYYVFGIICGILSAGSVALIIWLVNRKTLKEYAKYDERQVIGRGKAFQAGFYSLLVLEGSVLIWEMLGNLPLSPALWHFAALLAGVTVFAVTAIHYDAYIGMRDNPSRIIRSGALFTVAMVLSSITNLHSELTFSHIMGYMDLILAAAWVIIICALLIHRKKSQEETE